MKLSLLSLLFLLFFTACDSNNITDVQDSQKSDTKYLTILKAPVASVPISINHKIELEFSSVLDVESVNSQTAYMLDEYNQSLGLHLEMDNNKITFTPYQYLKPSSLYTVVVTTELKDINQSSLSQNYLYIFSTSKDDVDNTPLTIRALKPDNDARSVAVQSDIIIDFNKNLSLQTQYESNQYLKVINNETNKTIDGNIEIFNSLLKFSPKDNLPYDSNISVEVVDEIFDMYGNKFVKPLSFSFKTQSDYYGDYIYKGFRSLDKITTDKSSYMIKTIYNDINSSLIVVARQNAIDTYSIDFGTLPIKPKIRYLDSYLLTDKINDMFVLKNRYLILGTSGGIYSLDINNSKISLVQNYPISNIYGITVDNNRLYAVGPEVGLHIFDIDEEKGTFNFNSSQSKDIVGEALDVLLVNNKIFVANYEGSVVVLDSNISSTLQVDEKADKVKQFDINGSVKKLEFIQHFGEEGLVYVISSSGRIDGINLDASELKKIEDFPGMINDISIYKKFYSEDYSESNYYISALEKGLYIFGSYTLNIINIDGIVISSDIVEGFTSSIPFVVTLNQDGILNIFNANIDNSMPYVYSTPYNNGTIENDANISIYISDYYLDTATISKESFTFKDNTNSQYVDFEISILSEDNTITYILNPSFDLVKEREYSIIIDSNISDMLGNRLNNGVDINISFSVE